MAVPTSITDLSTTATSNSPAGSDSIGNPGKIDDYFRGYGAIQRAESMNKSWERWNHTPTYISATQFSVAGDKTAQYVVGRRTKATVTAGTVYGRISVSAFSTVTTVTVVNDSGSLDSGLSEIQLGPETYALGPGITGTGNRVFDTSPTIASPTFTGTTTVSGASGGFAIVNRSGTAVTYTLYDPDGASLQLDISGVGTLFKFFKDGRLAGTALHNNAGAVTGTTNQHIASGTYTPTWTNSANCTTLTPAACEWSRTGNVVTVSGGGDVTTSLNNKTTKFFCTLPIGMTVAAKSNIGGSGSFQLGSDIVGASVGVYAEVSGSNRAVFDFACAGGTVGYVSFIFTYVVL